MSVLKLVVLAIALAWTAESAVAEVGYYGVTTDKKIVQINLTSNTVTTIFNTPDVPYGLVIDSQGGFVYTQPFANEIRRYDPTTGADLLLAGSTQGIGGPRDIVLDPASNSVLVSNFSGGTITRTDLSSLVTNTVIAGFPSPQGLAFDSKGRLFAVAGGAGDCNSFAGNSLVFQIDPNTGAIVSSSTLNFDPTNSLDGFVFDYFTGSLFTIPRCSAVLSAVDTNTLSPIFSIPLGPSFAVNITSDGHGKLFVASRNDPGNGTNAQVTSYNIATNTFTASTLVPGLASLAISSERPVAVPNVVGITKGAATTAITAVGLVVGAVTTAVSNSIPAGSVISESPTAGTLVTAGSAVNLVLSGSQPISVTPSVGSGGRQLFSFVARDQLGASDIQYSQFLFSKSGLSALNACYISYDAVANVFYLLSDDMTQWYGLLGGSANTIGNGQCTIYGATSGSTAIGTDLTTNVDIGFRSGFRGLTNVYQFSGDILGDGSGWQSMGTWNNTGDPSQVELASLTPNSGAGTSQLFTAVTTDDDGGVTIPFVQFVMNNGLSGFNGCFIHYDRASNVFFLLNDAGTEFFGLLAGSAGQVSNSQCTLQGLGSGGTVVGPNLTVNYNLTFSGGFAGKKQIYMQAVNNTGVVEVWHQMATWTVAGATGPPASVTVAGGALQSAAVNTAFASALKALVTDATNKPVAGVTVNFAVPVNGASATLASSTAVTDVSGVASIMATANGTAGSYTVNASASGLPPVNFALTNTSVSGPVITVTNAIIGQNLQAQLTITLTPAAPPGGVTLSIQSSDGSKALLGGGNTVGYPSISSSLPAGLTTVSTFVQALTNTGSASIIVSAPGYPTATATVTFADSGFVIAGPNGAGGAFTASQGTSTPLTVSAGRLDPSGNFAASQQLRGGLFVRVPLSSDVANVGSVSAAFAPFIGGMDTATVQFLASATTLGTTNVMVGTPAGFSTPTTGTSVAITVLP